MLALLVLCMGTFWGQVSAGPKPPVNSLAPMLEKVLPAVVNISTRTYTKSRRHPLLDDPFFRRFFDLPSEQRRKRRTQSLGSGVIVDAGKGYLLTNHHVVEGADEITVTLRDQRQLKAELLGQDPEVDLALLRIEAMDLTALPMADSDQLRVGDFVVAIGSPFGLGQTVTYGIVSALGRSGLGIEGYENFIQTDASINPGNSGGALVNARGELIGINAASLEPSLQPYGLSLPEGIGFAIPVNLARGVMAELIEHGRVLRGWLGVQAIELSPGRAAVLGLSGGGLELTEVYPDSPAHEAGLRPGDILTDIDGQRVLLRANALNLIARLKPGSEVRIAGMRGDQRFERTITVVARPD